MAQMEQDPHTLMPHISSHIPSEADNICAMQVHTYETWEEDNIELHDTQYMEEGKDCFSFIYVFTPSSTLTFLNHFITVTKHNSIVCLFVLKKVKILCILLMKS